MTLKIIKTEFGKKRFSSLMELERQFPGLRPLVQPSSHIYYVGLSSPFHYKQAPRKEIIQFSFHNPAIIDLYDGFIVFYRIGKSANNERVFQTLIPAIDQLPSGKVPMNYSNRGYQYTSRGFNRMIEDLGLTYSMYLGMRLSR